MNVDINNLLGANNMDLIRSIRANNRVHLVQVPTEEHAYTLLTFLYAIGYQFGMPATFNGETRFEEYKDQTCYLLEQGGRVTYAELEYFQSESQYKDVPILKLT